MLLNDILDKRELLEVLDMTTLNEEDSSLPQYQTSEDNNVEAQDDSFVTENSHENNADNDSDTHFPSVEKLLSFMKRKEVPMDTCSSSDRIFGMVDTQTLSDSLTESSGSRLGSGREQPIELNELHDAEYELECGHSHADDTGVEVSGTASPQISEVGTKCGTSFDLRLSDPLSILEASGDDDGSRDSENNECLPSPELGSLISCRGNSIPHSFSQLPQVETDKWIRNHSDCNGPGKLACDTILDVLGEDSGNDGNDKDKKEKDEEGEKGDIYNRDHKDDDDDGPQPPKRRKLSTTLRDKSDWGRFTSSEAQPERTSSSKYGRRAKPISFAESISDNDEATLTVTSSSVALFENLKEHPAREISQDRRIITDIITATSQQLQNQGHSVQLEGQEWEIKRIIDEHTVKEAGTGLMTRYRVRWVDSWLTTDELVNAPELLRKYKARAHHRPRRGRLTQRKSTYS